MSGTRVKDQILEHKMLLTLLSLRKFQGFQELCVWNQGQRLNVAIKILLGPPIYKAFSNSVLGTEGRNQYIYFLLIHRWANKKISTI